MQNSKKYLIAAFLPFLVLSCTKQPLIQTVTEYADIPHQFKTIKPIPDLLEGETITVEQALDKGKELRISNCYYYIRYRELLRYVSFGEAIIEKPTNKQCPDI